MTAARFALAASVIGIMVGLGACPATANANADPQSHVIPRVERKAPADAPNVLLVLLDDAGFAASEVFGGPVSTPHYAALAREGARYNRFHTAAICSATRAALLTGRNHHRVGMGSITNVARNQPGYTSIIPDSAGTIGDVLQRNGYSTAWFGKAHVTPEWEITPAGPFDRWPTGLGFDYYYGFMGGATDQFAPNLVENRLQIEREPKRDYILDKDLADQAIGWVREHRAVAPDKPFFMYLASGSVHIPQQAPAEWIDRFKGQFDEGWDIMRQRIFERQLAQGIIPAGTKLPPRPEGLPTWDSLDAKQKAVAVRLMEVHAAQLAYFDHQFGRIVDELKRNGTWDNTLVIYIDGDNGADPQGRLDGTTIELLNGNVPSVEWMYDHLDQIGGPETFPLYPSGWAWAMSTPFPQFKSIASHLGGTRDGMVISWPGRVADAGAIRTQYSHVTDIAPTIYEAIGITPPEEIDGVEQMTLDGASLLATLTDPSAPSKHTSQYYEHSANRGFYADGWLAATVPPKEPWARGPVPEPESWNWALYHLDTDYSQSTDVSAQYPAKLAELKGRFEAAAAANNVFPLEASSFKYFTGIARPRFLSRDDTYALFPSSRPLALTAFPDTLNRSWSVKASIELSETGTSGALIAVGGIGSGWSLFLKENEPGFKYVSSQRPGDQWSLTLPALSPGKHIIELSFQMDGSLRPGASAIATLSADGGRAQSVHIEHTVSATYAYEGVGIGRDFGSGTDSVQPMPFVFEGEIEVIEMTVDR